MRAFAKKLGIGSAALSEIINGKRRVSPKMANRILFGVRIDKQKELTKEENAVK